MARFRACRALVLAISACGTNDGVRGPAAPRTAQRSSEPRGSAPASAAAAELSGELTVWAMGNEGTKLRTLADAFMAENPGVKVSVTPVDWGQAVAKLQTAIAGNQTPDVSQMGTDMMGQFGATGALEPVPANFDPSTFFESAWNTNIVDGVVSGVPWYVETRLLYYRTDIAEKAGITSPPATWDDLKAMAKAMKEKGGADVGHRRSARRTGRSTCRSCGRTAATSSTRAASLRSTARRPSRPSPSTSRSSRKALTPTSVPEGFDTGDAIRHRRHTRCSSRARGTSA